MKKRMMNNNKAAWLVGIKNLQIQPYHLPPLGTNDVKVQIKALGIYDNLGLVTILASRAFGAPKVIIADVNDQRLTVAKVLGANGTVKVSSNIQDIGEKAEKIHKTMGDGIDISFDCVGFDKTMSTALNATWSGGKAGLVGLGQSQMTIPLVVAAAREVDVVGIFRYRNTWPLCIELLRTGKIDVKPHITHRFKFTQEDIEKAFETSARGGNQGRIQEFFLLGAK